MRIYRLEHTGRKGGREEEGFVGWGKDLGGSRIKGLLGSVRKIMDWGGKQGYSLGLQTWC